MSIEQLELRHEASKLEAFDNLLVGQKDKVLAMVNEKQYADAVTVLEVLAPLWLANSYAYKLREIAYRLGHELFEMKSGLHHRATAQKAKLTDLMVRADELHKLACLN